VGIIMDYLDQHGLPVYISDVMSRINEEKPQSIRGFMLDYFDAVSNGTNVLFRDFTYIKATPRNRISFAAQLASIVNSNPKDSYKPADYFHMIELISTGFPVEIVERASDVTEYLLGLRDPRNQSEPAVALPKKSFLSYFKICFYYTEFLDLTEKVILSTFLDHFSHSTNSMASITLNSTDLTNLKFLFRSQLQDQLTTYSPS
ncbi:hypothetical protein HDU99_004407, partial [Rhizoclosmatium hyalinum]